MTKGVSFENKKGSHIRMPAHDHFAHTPKAPFTSRFLIKKGIAKNERQANRMLALLSAALVVTSLVILSTSARPPRVESIRLKVRPHAEMRAPLPPEVQQHLLDNART